MRSQEQMEEVIEKYADMIKRICFLHLKNEADTEDVFQSVFLKYFQSEQLFENEEHEKAWFIRVAMNACKDWLRYLKRHPSVPLDSIAEQASCEEEKELDLLKEVLSLPSKYRRVIYLYYYEEYSAVEIAQILKKSENTIYTWLSRGRNMLRQQIGGE